MPDMQDAFIETGCITGNCGTCTLCVEGKIMTARWEAYQSLLCPGCQVVESVSSRRYSHEELWSAENEAYDQAINMEKDATREFALGFIEGWDTEEGTAAIKALLDCLERNDHHA
jgi:hypothetical protein